MTLSLDGDRPRRRITACAAQDRYARTKVSNSRLRLVDTFAVLSFFTLVGGLNEWIVVGMTPQEVLVTRTAAIPILLISGAIYGAWRDMFHRLTRFHHRSSTGQAVIDTAACLMFRVPIYGMILWLGGATGAAFFLGLLTGAMIIALSGRPCGIWMDFLRSVFGCTPRNASFLARTG